MTAPADIATALRNHAEGSCCLAAAAELLIAQSWLHRADFIGNHFADLGRGQPIDVGRRLPIQIPGQIADLARVWASELNLHPPARAERGRWVCSS